MVHEAGKWKLRVEPPSSRKRKEKFVTGEANTANYCVYIRNWSHGACAAFNQSQGLGFFGINFSKAQILLGAYSFSRTKLSFTETNCAVVVHMCKVNS